MRYEQCGGVVCENTFLENSLSPELGKRIRECGGNYTVLNNIDSNDISMIIIHKIHQENSRTTLYLLHEFN